jgi:hypothetical protein
VGRAFSLLMALTSAMGSTGSPYLHPSRVLTYRHTGACGTKYPPVVVGYPPGRKREMGECSQVSTPSGIATHGFGMESPTMAKWDTALPTTAKWDIPLPRPAKWENAGRDAAHLPSPSCS